MLLSIRMKLTPTASRAPPAGDYVIRGKPYVDPEAAVRIIDGAASETTIRRWIRMGWTSFGYTLDTIPYGGGFRSPKRTAEVVREFLHRHPLPSRATSSIDRRRFKRAAEALSLIEPRSSYSRARRPTVRILEL